MSVRVNLDAGWWDMELNQQTAHTVGEMPFETAEIFADVLETIAATLRRMYPPPPPAPRVASYA